MNERDSFMIHRSTRRSLIGTVLAVALLLAIAMPAQSQNQNPGVIPPQAHPHGMTYGEWSARWWQWLFSLPVDANNPYNWQNTNNCSTGQLGSVWFLVGQSPNPGTVTITCDIPAGKALFFPILNSECSNLEAPPFFGATAADRQTCVEQDLTGSVSLTATVDGVAIQNLTSALSPNFSFVVPPPPNLLGLSTGASGESVADGFYLMLAPLSAGKHTIHFTAEVNNTYIGDFRIDTTYNLTVGP